MSVLSPPTQASVSQLVWRADHDPGTGGSIAPYPLGHSAIRRLEDALADEVATSGRSRLDPSRLDALLDRLGLRGRPPLTLAEAGRRAGLSGERVRQLEARVRKHYAARGGRDAPAQLHAALDAVARVVPLPVAAVEGLLMDAGIAAGPFSAGSLLCAAELFGCPVPFVVMGSGTGGVLLPKGAATAAANAGLIESRARRQVERCGATTLGAVQADLADEGTAVSCRQIRLVLDTCRALVDCGAGWFSFRDAKTTGPFVRASCRMLAVAPSLPVVSLHDGLRRHNAFRRLPAPPPVPVLAEVYRHHRRFVVEEDGRVSSIELIDEDIVGPLNKKLIGILRDAPDGVYGRPELLDACHRAGLNLTSVNLYTTYSECLERIGPGLFAVRGTAVAADTGRRRRGRQRQDGPVSGWMTDGRPWLAGTVTPSTWANGVVHVPAALRLVLQGRHFSCHGPDGSLVTTIGVDRHGNSWGWTGFLRRTAAQPGDVVRAIFDTTAGTVALELVSAVPPSAAG